MMKPLYLDGSKQPIHIVLEHNALRIQCHSRALQYFPLRRVSRIITSGQTHWQTEALLACADKGITITFIGSNGKARARLLSGKGIRSSLPQRVIDFLQRPDWQQHYRCWHAAHEHNAALKISRELQLDSSLLKQQQRLKRYLDRRLEMRLSRPLIKRCENILYSLLLADITAQLTAAGFDNRLQPSRNECPDFSSDFSHIIIWSLRWHFFNDFLITPKQAKHKRIIETIDDTRIIQSFQNFSQQCGQQVTMLQLNLNQMLLSVENGND